MNLLPLVFEWGYQFYQWHTKHQSGGGKSVSEHQSWTPPTLLEETKAKAAAHPFALFRVKIILLTISMTRRAASTNDISALPSSDVNPPYCSPLFNPVYPPLPPHGHWPLCSPHRHCCSTNYDCKSRCRLLPMCLSISCPTIRFVDCMTSCHKKEGYGKGASCPVCLWVQEV